MITREALRVLHAKLSFINKVDRQYDDQFAKTGAKIGTTLRVRKPPKYTVRTNATLSTQDATETYVSLPVTNQYGVDMTFSSAELTLQIDDFSKRFIDPAMAQLAATIENTVLTNLYKAVPAQVGATNAIFNSLTPALNAKRVMSDELTPIDSRYMLVNTDAQATLVNALSGLFHSSSEIDKQYEQGVMGKTAGFTWFENTLLPVHTVGTYGGTPLTNYPTDAFVSGASSLVTDGWTVTTTALNVGDVFTIDGVYAVHPETKASLGYLRQFTVTTASTTDGSGNSTIAFSPAIVSTGAFKNCSNVPGNNKAITVLGSSTASYGLNLAFHPSAFTFATADLEDVSQYGAWGSRANYDGISLRIARQYAIGTDTVPTRIDVLFGYAALYPHLACRVANSQSSLSAA